MLHICCILPASILAVFQFLPAIRHRFLLYHRMAGYSIILLVLVSNAGYVIIAPIAMGGDLPTQTFLGFLAIITTTTLALALYGVQYQETTNRSASSVDAKNLVLHRLCPHASPIAGNHARYYHQLATNGPTGHHVL
jgi:hypothetical protein